MAFSLRRKHLPLPSVEEVAYTQVYGLAVVCARMRREGHNPPVPVIGPTVSVGDQGMGYLVAIGPEDDLDNFISIPDPKDWSKVDALASQALELLRDREEEIEEVYTQFLIDLPRIQTAAAAAKEERVAKLAAMRAKKEQAEERRRERIRPSSTDIDNLLNMLEEQTEQAQKPNFNKERPAPYWHSEPQRSKHGLPPKNRITARYVDIDDIGERLDRKMSDMSESIEQRFDSVSENFEHKFDDMSENIERTLEGLSGRTKRLKRSVVSPKWDNSIEEMIAKIQKYD